MASMPVVFVGHGNPMHALADNEFTRMLARLGRELPRPKAVLCVSAHWMTEGTWAAHMEKPRTIHDFYGFPEKLFAVKYPAPGAPPLAERVRRVVERPTISLDDESWGLDHGAWAVLRHMYPDASVPVAQLSVYMEQPPAYHHELGEKLRPLREEGVLILGSGNVVHNLRLARLSGEPQPYPWAVELERWIVARLERDERAALLAQPDDIPNGRLGIPSPDHWYPFLTALGAAAPGEPLRVEHSGIENASISMLTLRWG